MDKGLTELVFILDRSASMEGLEKETVDGFNSMIEKQKKEKDKSYVTTVLFSDVAQGLYFRKPLHEVINLTEQDYCVKGRTALLDAIGNTIYKMKSEKTSHRRKVIMVIITDGLENASREFRYDILEKLIRKMKDKHGWEFLFLGANMDAVKEAARIGISESRSVTYANDSVGVELSYKGIGDAVRQMRQMSDQSALVDGSWKEKIEVDYVNRELNLH